MDAERDRLARLLEHHGRRRGKALETARRETDEIAALLPAALRAGIKKSQIATLSGLSRPAIDALLRRSS